MHFLECVVTEVMGLPYKLYDNWYVPVKYDGMGSICEECDVMCDTHADALAVSVGYKFLG